MWPVIVGTSKCHLVKQKRRWNVNYRYSESKNQSLVETGKWYLCCTYIPAKDVHVPLGPKYSKEAISPLSLSWSSAKPWFLFTSPLLARIFILLLHLTEQISNRSPDILSENRDMSCDLQRLSRQQFGLYMLSYSAWIEGCPAGIVIHVIVWLCALI